MLDIFRRIFLYFKIHSFEIWLPSIYQLDLIPLLPGWRLTRFNGPNRAGVIILPDDRSRTNIRNIVFLISGETMENI
jgi:hypothetical protein